MDKAATEKTENHDEDDVVQPSSDDETNADDEASNPNSHSA